MTRSTLRVIARFLAAVLVLAQLSIAAYACPRLVAPKANVMAVDATVTAASTVGTVVEAAASEPMAGCAGMLAALDQDAANLCAEHCKAGQQSADVPTFSVTLPLLNVLYTVLLTPVEAPPPRPVASRVDALVAASPPLAVLLCVYRI